MNQHIEPWILPYVRILVLCIVVHLAFRAWTQARAQKKKSALLLSAASVSIALILGLRYLFG